MASRQFSIPTVLRMVPNDLLSDVFDRLGQRDAACAAGME
jgi:hypothetical protein